MSKLTRIELPPPIKVKTGVKKYTNNEVNSLIQSLHKNKLNFFTVPSNTLNNLLEALSFLGILNNGGIVGNASKGTVKVHTKIFSETGLIQNKNGEYLIVSMNDNIDSLLELINRVSNYLQIRNKLLNYGYTIVYENINKDTIHSLLKNDAGEEYEIIAQAPNKLTLHSKNFENHEKCDKIIKETLEEIKEYTVIEDTYTEEIQKVEDDYESDEELENEIEYEQEESERNENEIG